MKMDKIQESPEAQVIPFAYTMAEEIIAGRRLRREDELSFLLSEGLEELCAGADKIREALCKNLVRLCSIINGRSGKCSEDCKFCAQSACYESEIKEYPFLPPEEIVKDYMNHREAGVERYSIVTAGRALDGKEMEQALNAYKRMSDIGGMGLCASHGLLSQEMFYRLKEAGVSRYHANIETSRSYFPNICTSHTYQDKVEVIRRAREAGLEVCSGGIIGMGESWEDRIEMAISLYEMEVLSIPLNILQPIKGTPFENKGLLSEEDILRTIAIFRYLNPKAEIRLAAGRNRMSRSGEKAFRAGANAAITGDMLTTSGNSIRKDRKMLAFMGFKISHNIPETFS